MAQDTGFFGQLGLPTADRAALERLQRLKEQQLFQERVQQQGQALTGPNRNVFGAFANLGRAVGEQIDPTELDPETQRQLELRDSIRMAMARARTGVEDPEMQEEAMYRAAARVAAQSGAPEIASQLLTEYNDRSANRAYKRYVIDPAKEAEKIQATLERARAAEEAGDTQLADGLYARYLKMSGIEVQKPSKMLRLVREMGLDPTKGEGLELMERYAEKQAGITNRDRAIQRLARREGLDQEWARDAVDGLVSIERDAKRGVMILTNEATGEVREVPIGTGRAVEESAGIGADQLYRFTGNAGETMYELAEYATGAGNLLALAGERIAALANVDTEGKRTIAMQSMRNYGRLMKRALAMNPRFPVAEMEAIDKELQFDPAAFDSPQLMRKRLKNIYGFMAESRARMVDSLNRAETPSDRDDLTNQIRATDQFMSAVAPDEVRAEWDEELGRRLRLKPAGGQDDEQEDAPSAPKFKIRGVRPAGG